jgi:L-amino acid N-acyltransferase YncA
MNSNLATPILRSMQKTDWERVKTIYLEGIATGNATFQTGAPSWEVWDKNHLPICRLVAEMDDIVLGWAMLSPVSNRCVYAGVAEVSVYVAKQAQNKGLGYLLLNQLISESEANGLWTLESGIFPENTASINLHKRCGFREIGRREKLGKQNRRWRDVLLLERRSTTVM